MSAGVTIPVGATVKRPRVVTGINAPAAMRSDLAALELKLAAVRARVVRVKPPKGLRKNLVMYLDARGDLGRTLQGDPFKGEMWNIGYK